jgi:hypothetical protein
MLWVRIHKLEVKKYYFNVFLNDKYFKNNQYYNIKQILKRKCLQVNILPGKK